MGWSKHVPFCVLGLIGQMLQNVECVCVWSIAKLKTLWVIFRVDCDEPILISRFKWQVFNRFGSSWRRGSCRLYDAWMLVKIGEKRPLSMMSRQPKWCLWAAPRSGWEINWNWIVWALIKRDRAMGGCMKIAKNWVMWCSIKEDDCAEGLALRW